MNWKDTYIDVGKVKENSRVRVIFEGTEHLPKIDRIVPGCASCTSVSFDERTKELAVVIKLLDIPKHLKRIEEQIFNKIITVTYHSGAKEVLSITGIKIRS